MTNYCYLRVSTEDQTIDSQRVCINEYCNKYNIKIDKEIKEKVSGTIEASKRNLKYILRDIKKGDLLIVSELSRLGRNTKDVLNTCEILTNRGADVMFIKENMRMDNSPMGKMLRTIMAAFSQLERDMISLRTKEGLARTRAQGTILGRRKGAKAKSYILDKKQDKIIDLLNKQVPKMKIIRDLRISKSTLYYYINNVLSINQYGYYEAK